MGLFDSLFGSGSKAEVVSPARIENVSTQTEEQKAALKNLLASLGMGEIEGNFDPLTEAQNTSLAALEQLALNAASPEGQQPNVDSINALSSIINRGPADTDAYFTETVQRPALEAFREEVQPGISRRFGQGNNFFSSDRQRADDTAGENLIDSLTRERTRVAFEERSRTTQEILAAAGLLPQVQAGRVGAIAAPSAGIEQIRGGADQRRQQLINNVLAALGIQATENIAFAPGIATSGGQQGIIGDLLGTAVGAAKLFL